MADDEKTRRRWFRRKNVHKNWYRLCPEVALFPDDVSCRVALRKAQRRVFGSLRFWLALIPIMFVGVFFRLYVLERFLTQLVSAIVAGCFLGAAGYLPFVLLKGVMQRSLRRSLKALNITVCQECGYDLRATESPRCPECGAPFDRPA